MTVAWACPHCGRDDDSCLMAIEGARHELAKKYVEDLDFIDDQHRRIAGEGFLAGFAAGVREVISTSRPASRRDQGPDPDIKNWCVMPIGDKLLLGATLFAAVLGLGWCAGRWVL